MVIPHLGYGGAERAFLRLADFLSTSHDVTIALMADDWCEDGSRAAQAQTSLRVVMLDDDRKPTSGLLAKTMRWFRMGKRLRALKDEHDVAISFLSGANLLNSLIGPKSKTVVSVRGSRSHDFQVSKWSRVIWLRLWDPLIYRHARHVVAASCGLRREIIESCPAATGKTVAIEGTIISEQLLAKVEADPGIVAAELEKFETIVSLGRLHPTKGFDFLLRAFSEVRRSRQNARLLLIGDGPELSRLELLAQELGLRTGALEDLACADVIFAGFMRNPLVYLRLCNVFVFPSRTEGLPNALIEALASGIPVLAADCHWGPRSILSGTSGGDEALQTKQAMRLPHGVLLPVPEAKDAHAIWSREILEVLEHPVERRTRQQALAAIKRFDISTTGPDWVRIIESSIAVRSPLRVLMLITNLGQGGAERVFHDHATAFAANGIAVEQAVFAGEYDDAYQTQLPLHHLPIAGWLSWLGSPGRLIARSLALRSLVEAKGFDVVVSHMDGANWVNALSGSSAGKVLVVHGSLLHDKNQLGWRQWVRTRVLIPFFYNRVQAPVAVSEGIRRELIQLGVKRPEAIPNFFDFAAIKHAAAEDLPDDAIEAFEHRDVLVTSGRLSAQKNQVELLRLFAVIRARRAGVRLLVLGDGERREELLLACRHFGLRARHPWPDSPSADASVADVWFLGYQKNPFPFLARSQLFVFPSSWEGFPLSLCEAMACGVPVLSSDCPTGPREIIAPDTDPTPLQATSAVFTDAGVLLPMLDSDESREIWTNTVLQLLDAPDRRSNLARGGAAAVERLDRGVILARWHAVLQRVAGSRA